MIKLYGTHTLVRVKLRTLNQISDCINVNILGVKYTRILQNVSPGGNWAHWISLLFLWAACESTITSVKMFKIFLKI